MKQTKKHIIKEMLTSDEPTSYDLIALKADCEVSYVKSVEKEMMQKEPEPVQGEGFTPGEWIAYKLDSGEWLINEKMAFENGERAVIAFLQEPPYNTEKNAILIAAAPDMYHALENIILFHEKAIINNGGQPHLSKAKEILNRINQSK